VASHSLESSSSAAAGTRQTALLACLFHLNLAFSSLEEERQGAVVARCYRPMLALARRTAFPIAIEAPGWTLERIAEHDPGWLVEARQLIDAGRVEFVGSSYAQCAAPLLPADVNRWNLRLGLEVYERLLGTRPRLALIGEQAYSPGLLALYRDVGYEGIIADWDNAFRSHPDWGRAVRSYPQLAQAPGAELPVVWSESIAFQKFQRYAHGEMTREAYLEFVTGAVKSRNGALMLYANDAEVFDHRPGRFAAEPEMQEREWDRIADALEALVTADIGSPALPREVLALLDRPEAGEPLSLEAADQPIPVKKQDKYNVSRWAVTGRDDIDLNTRCGRLYEHLRASGNEDPDSWRELCSLWASDFRTHITESRWQKARAQLATAEKRWGLSPTPAPEPPVSLARGGTGRVTETLPDRVSRVGRLLRVQAGDLDVLLNPRRGLAVASFSDRSVSRQALFGTIEHGYFETIELGADWYTGNLVQEPPLRHKVTDLESVTPTFEADGERITIAGTITGELGAIDKAVTIEPGGITVDWTLRWEELPAGSLRFGHVTLLPEAFDPASLFYATHNGGDQLERHLLTGGAVDHGAPVSALVSARMGLGATEGLLLLGDERTQVRVELDQEIARPLGLISYRPGPARFFLRASFSLTESDETRRGPIPRSPDRPQRARLRYTARAGS
jgi:hypothetical protein